MFSAVRLRQLRTERAMSREALAVAIGRSYPSVHNYERGSVVPPTETVEHIADALGCEIGDLFEAAS